MDLMDSFRSAHHFTRTSLENVERFREALGLENPAEAEITENRKMEISVDWFGDWSFIFRSYADADTNFTMMVTFNISKHR